MRARICGSNLPFACQSRSQGLQFGEQALRGLGRHEAHAFPVAFDDGAQVGTAQPFRQLFEIAFHVARVQPFREAGLHQETERMGYSSRPTSGSSASMKCLTMPGMASV